MTWIKRYSIKNLIIKNSNLLKFQKVLLIESVSMTHSICIFSYFVFAESKIPIVCPIRNTQKLPYTWVYLPSLLSFVFCFNWNKINFTRFWINPFVSKINTRATRSHTHTHVYPNTHCMKMKLCFVFQCLLINQKSLERV